MRCGADWLSVQLAQVVAGPQNEVDRRNFEIGIKKYVAHVKGQPGSQHTKRYPSRRISGVSSVQTSEGHAPPNRRHAP
jgi:hypothetical protein